jgi:hypothetical protein
MVEMFRSELMMVRSLEPGCGRRDWKKDLPSANDWFSFQSRLFTRNVRLGRTRSRAALCKGDERMFKVDEECAKVMKECAKVMKEASLSIGTDKQVPR